MRSLSLLQLGDVHFPEANACRALADIKDDAAPTALTSALTITPLRLVVRDLCARFSDNRPDAVLLCGDLTDRGNLDGYRDCVSHLMDAFLLNDPDQWGPNQIHVVPGNHDIARPAVYSPDRDPYEKFSDIAAVWDAVDLPILPVADHRVTDVSRDDVTAHLVSMNSCLGCGELRGLPDEVSGELRKVLAGFAAAGHPPEKVFEVVGEQLDTPAVAEEVFATVVRELNTLPSDVLPVLLAHHNLLPQAQTRVAVYTELLNSGHIRTELASLRRPVVYLHGHIHADPVEVLASPQHDNAPLVLISAPRLIDGFNVLDVHFADSGPPIGLTVRPYRLSNHGSVEQRPLIRVPFYQRGPAWSDPGPLCEELLRTATDAPVRFRNLRSALSDEFEVATDDVLVYRENLGCAFYGCRLAFRNHGWRRRTTV